MLENYDHAPIKCGRRYKATVILLHCSITKSWSYEEMNDSSDTRHLVLIHQALLTYFALYEMADDS